MKILVLGAGGIGGYFGGRLAEGGADVTFLVRPKRREQLEQDGLRVDSPLGDIRLRVKTTVASELRPGYDLVLLTCKAYDLESAMDAIAPAIDGTCCIVPLLNGMAHLARLDERFGAENVLGGTCALNVTLLDDGTIRHANRIHRLIFGERDRSASTRATAFAETLAKTTIDWELSSDVEQDLWEKIVALSALAAVTCLFRANVSEIMKVPGGPAAFESALGTNVEIATREGHAPRAAAMQFAHRMLMDPTSTLTASMLRDLENGGPVESDHIVGWMLEKARKYSLDDTILSLAYTHLKAYEARRAARPDSIRARSETR